MTKNCDFLCHAPGTCECNPLKSPKSPPSPQSAKQAAINGHVSSLATEAFGQGNNQISFIQRNYHANEFADARPSLICSNCSQSPHNFDATNADITPAFTLTNNHKQPNLRWITSTTSTLVICPSCICSDATFQFLSPTNSGSCSLILDTGDEYERSDFWKHNIHYYTCERAKDVTKAHNHQPGQNQGEDCPAL